MSDNNGWIKLHRSLLKHWLFSFNEPEKCLAWIDLLMNATFKPCEVMIKGRVIKLDRGQQCRSQITLQKDWNWSQNKVKRFLKLLHTEGMISFETNDLTTIITICNYDKYQVKEEESERPDERADERGTDEQTNDNIRSKERKEVKKKEILDFSTWPCIPNEQLLNDWLKAKKRAKGSVSQSAINTVGHELHKAVTMGFSVDECLKIAENSGWRGFKAEWMGNKNQNINGNVIPYQPSKGRQL